MRLPILVGLALCLSAAPAAAQFSAYYAGTLRMDGKDVPCSTQFSPPSS